MGQLPIPTQLLRAGTRDIVRVSDARMSWHQLWHMRRPRGTGVSHRGSPCTGRRRRSNCARRADGDDLTLRSHRPFWRSAGALGNHGDLTINEGGASYIRDSVGQANEGCDLDFLKAGGTTPEPAIH